MRSRTSYLLAALCLSTSVGLAGEKSQVDLAANPDAALERAQALTITGLRYERWENGALALAAQAGAAQLDKVTGDFLLSDVTVSANLSPDSAAHATAHEGRWVRGARELRMSGGVDGGTEQGLFHAEGAVGYLDSATVEIEGPILLKRGDLQLGAQRGRCDLKNATLELDQVRLRLQTHALEAQP